MKLLLFVVNSFVVVGVRYMNITTLELGLVLHVLSINLILSDLCRACTTMGIFFVCVQCNFHGGMQDNHEYTFRLIWSFCVVFQI